MALESFQYRSAYIGIGDFDLNLSNATVTTNHISPLIFLLFWIPEMTQSLTKERFL